jgi:hypothetical protein
LTEGAFMVGHGNSRVADVRAAVAEAIRRPEGYGLDAHRTMLDLATSRAGVTRLVTTNFDLLFALAISDYGGYWLLDF